MNRPPSSIELPDPALLALAAQGDREAFGLLVGRNQVLATSIAYSHCGDFQRSQDIAQEAFVAAWQQLGQLEDRAKFKPWLCGIVRNLSRNALRQQLRRGEQVTDLHALPPQIDPTPSPRDQAVTREDADLVWHTLQQLPEIYREPLILFYREQQSVAQVAVTLDLSEEVVRQRLQRGRSQMRDQIERIVARTLNRTSPGAMFTSAVLGALPISASGVASSFVAAKGGAVTKSFLSLAALSHLALPFVGLIGAYVSDRHTARFARDPDDRRFLRRVNWVSSLGFAIIMFAMVARSWRDRVRMQEWSEQAQSALALHQPVPPIPVNHQQSAYFTFGLLILLYVFIAGLVAWNGKRFVAAVRNTKMPAEMPAWRKRIWLGPDKAIGWQTRTTFLGLPLLAIRFGESAESPQVRGVARGWIAIGDVAQAPLFALGGAAFGGIAIGGLAVGVLSCGAVSLGGVAFAFLAVGGVANGQFAIGYTALGTVLAIGWEAASGMIAIADHIAVGPLYASADHVRDQVSRQWLQSHPLSRTAESLRWVFTFAPALLIPLITMLGMSYFARRRATDVTVPKAAS